MWVTRVQPWVDGWDQAEENVALATPAHRGFVQGVPELVPASDSLPLDIC